jgi:Cd2+/Zn2+-exporting ATPase
MGREEQTAVYRIEGLSCTSCAKKFEYNVKQIATVTEAEVNFGAAKLTVRGEATLAQLEQAGAFDHLQLVSEQGTSVKRRWYQQRQYQQLMLSTISLIAGFGVHVGFGENYWLTISLYLLATLISGTTLFVEGIKNLIRFRFDMMTLMTIAIIGAFAIGEWGEAATVVVLFAISEAMERFSLDRARKSLRMLVDLSPTEALVRRGEQQQVVPVSKVNVGDICLIKAGQQIAVDGKVVLGHSAVNQATITGESIPVSKQVGDEVFAGTLNESGYLEVEVTKTSQDTTLAKIIQLVEDAQANRASSQKFIDQFAKYYTPAILLLALLLAAVPPLFQGDWLAWLYRGLTVLVVGCPCALVISTPVAIMTAIGNAARLGVLIKGGAYLEELSKVQTVALDKTGTLTTGKPIVVAYESLVPEKDNDFLRIAAGLEAGSTHPLASAIVHYANKVDPVVVSDFQSHIARGVSGSVNGQMYQLGNPTWLRSLVTPELEVKIKAYQQVGNTVVLLASATEVLALFAVADQLRPQSKQLVQKLQAEGMQVFMLTGDNPTTAQAIAEQANIDHVHAALLPDEKQQVLHQLREQGNTVAMIGDGINDAPALATANVGVALGGESSDTALETADIVLMSSDLNKFPFAIRLSRLTKRIMGQNIAIALGLKLLALLLIVPGWLTLWLAVFADMGATVLVTCNALRLLRRK